MSTDLFGQPIIGMPPQNRFEKKKRNETPRGYADVPGTGPKGETCKSCKHFRRIECAKVYFKCALLESKWTGGFKTDIRAKSPACSKWNAK